MNKSKKTGDNMVRFDPGYELRPYPHIRTKGFEDADAQANAFLSVWRSNFDKEMLELIASKLSPQAVRIVKWWHGELQRARINSPESMTIDRYAPPESFDEGLEQARLADDGCVLCDDNA